MQNDVEKGMYLVVYEMIAVMITANILAPKFYNAKIKLSKDIELKKINNHFIYHSLIVVAIIFLIIFPTLRQEFIPYFFKSNLNESLYYERSFGLGIIVISFARNIFVLLAISYFNNKYIKKEKIIYPIISIIIIGTDLIFTSGMSRWTIVIPGIAYLYLLMIVFKKHRKTIFLICGGLIGFGFIVMTITKSFGNEDTLNMASKNIDITWLAEYIRGYFIGPKSVALSYPINEYFNSINLNSIQVFLNDLFSSVPGFSNFTTYEYTTPNIFNYYIYYNHIAKDAIVPMISQGYVYFGFILSPLFSCLSVFMMMWLERKAIENSSDIVQFYICTYVSIWFARAITLNITIVFSHFFNRFCLLYLLYKINEYIVIKKSKEIRI